VCNAQRLFQVELYFDKLTTAHFDKHFGRLNMALNAGYPWGGYVFSDGFCVF
jgi:hypothetical protein